jgi:hypothetical protein
MANLALAFNLSASATGMAQGINAGVVELQKLGYSAKQTARDVSTLKTLEISKVFVSAIQSVASSFTQFTSGAAAAVDRTRQLAQNLGVSYGELRQLQVAADLSGASTDDLAKAFTRAQVTITNAGRGSKEAVGALGRLGLSVKDLATQTTTQQFSAIAGAINAIQNPAERAAAAVAIFGRSGAELLPTFRELPENLKIAGGFLAGFRDGVEGVNPDAIDAIGDSFGLASQSLQELAARILTQLAPALTSGADQFVKFVQGIDVSAAAEATRQALQTVADVFGALAGIAAPLARNLLPAIGGYLAFINRQAIAGGIAGLARIFAAAASAAFGYSAAAGTAAAATATLGASIRTTLVSTGIGALVVGLGLLAGAALEWAVASNASGGDAQAAIDQATEATKKLQRELQGAATVSIDLGAQVSKALKVPEEISIREFAQGGIDAARSAIVSLAGELGGLDEVPAGLVKQFTELQGLVRFVNREHQNEAQWLGVIDDRARALQEQIKKLTASRQADADAAKAQSEAAKRAAEESRKRVGELASQGLTPAEQNRVKLNQDLIDIGRERAAAEAALGEAMKARDGQAIAAAKERLRLAGEAVNVAKNQDRDRQLQALGIDDNLLKPAKSIAQEFLNVRKAFDQKLIDGNEAGIALRNLAAEGIQIRQEINAELARPAQRALQVSDVRTSEGFAQFLNTGRPDPALEQRREQLQKLNEIKQAIIATGAQPALILGAG